MTLTPAERIRAALDRCGVTRDFPLIVGVSGGGDSLALALILYDLGYGNMTAITVNHGLRPEAAKEAKQVGRWLKAAKIPHQILTYKGVPPISDVEARARQLRYGLLREYASRRKIAALAIAHTLEDKAETFLLRLGRGSGLYGLAAMDEENDMDGLRILRPCLDVRRAELRAYLTARGQPWIDDPMNDDARYARVKIRRLLPDMESAGIPIGRIALAAFHLRRVKKLVEQQAAALGVTYHKKGAYIPLDAFAAADPEVAMRVLGETLARVGDKEFSPRFASLEDLYKSLLSGTLKRRTLGGCIVSLRPIKRLIAVTVEGKE